VVPNVTCYVSSGLACAERVAHAHLRRVDT
jgi:hypothetical protein